MDEKDIKTTISVNILTRQELHNIKRRKKNTNSMETYNELIKNLILEHYILSSLRDTSIFKELLNNDTKIFKSIKEYLYGGFYKWN